MLKVTWTQYDVDEGRRVLEEREVAVIVIDPDCDLDVKVLGDGVVELSVPEAGGSS